MADTNSTNKAVVVRPNERYKLTHLKEQLAEALGEDGPEYWNALRDFVQGKLNRQEFDFYAYMYLPGEKSSLHNQFILATIHNAKSGQAPPAGENNKGFEQRKRGYDGDDDDSTGPHSKQSRRSIKALLEDPKWRYIKELIKSLNKTDRRAIKMLLKKPNVTPQRAEEAIRAMKPVILPLPQSKLPQSYAMDIAKGITAPLVYDTKATPDADALSYRMVAIALEQGLPGGVTRESGELLLYALDCHLKNIVSNMIYKIRANRALGIPVTNPYVDKFKHPVGSPPSPQHPLPLSSSSRPTTGSLRLRDRLYYSKSTLRLSDLVFSLEISPYATVEPPMCLERCGNLLAKQEGADRCSDEGDSPVDVFANLEPSAVVSGGPGATTSDGGRSVSAAAAAVAHVAPGGDLYSQGMSEEDIYKQRRKIRRLRARYERWFGPYVTVQLGGNGQENQ